jgi:hypothetical protein
VPVVLELILGNKLEVLVEFMEDSIHIVLVLPCDFKPLVNIFEIHEHILSFENPLPQGNDCLIIPFALHFQDAKDIVSWVSSY